MSCQIEIKLPMHQLDNNASLFLMFYSPVIFYQSCVGCCSVMFYNLLSCHFDQSCVEGVIVLVVLSFWSELCTCRVLQCWYWQWGNSLDFSSLRSVGQLVVNGKTKSITTISIQLPLENSWCSDYMRFHRVASSFQEYEPIFAFTCCISLKVSDVVAFGKVSVVSHFQKVVSCKKRKFMEVCNGKKGKNSHLLWRAASLWSKGGGGLWILWPF